MRRMSLAAISGFLVWGLLLGACAPAAPAPIPKPAAEQPQYGGILTTAQMGDVPGFDPHQETSGPTGWAVIPVYNRLIKYNPLDPNWREIIPDLAESWEMSTDGLTYTFHLRQGVKWHDGQPFTSEDAAYSLMRIAHPPKGVRSPRQLNLGAMDRVETPDANTLKVTLKYPSASFLPFLAVPWMLIAPKHVLEREGQDALKGKLVGTGPFRFKEYMRGVSLEGVKNPDYFIKGRPYLDGFIHYPIRDEAARLAAFRTRQLLYIPSIPGILTTDAEVLKKALGDKIKVQEGVVTNVNQYGMNVKRKPFDDVRVRQAISLALDRESYLQLVYQGVGEVSGWMPTSGQWALPKEELAKLPGFGPDMKARIAEAKKLLAEAGYPNGFKTSGIGIAESPSGKRSIEWLASVLPAIGVNFDPLPMERGAFDSTLVKGGFDIYAQSFMVIIDDPDAVFGGYLVAGAGRNYTGYSNPQIAKLYEQQTRTLDPKKRREIVDEMHKIALRDAPVAVMGYMGLTLVTWAEVRNVLFPRATITMSPSDIQEVWLAE